MYTKTQHIIQKKSLEVEFQDISAKIELKDELAELTKKRLLPAIENLFSEYGRNNYITFEKLEIDAGMITFNNWQDELVEQVVSELKEKLINHRFLHHNQVLSIHESKTGAGDPETREAEILLHFIKTGRLPWFCSELKPGELKDNLDVILNRSDQFFISALQEIFNENSRAVIRLIYQFTEEQLAKILLQLSFQVTGFKIIKAWAALMTELGIKKQEQKRIIYASVFSAAVEKMPEQILVKTLSENILFALTENDRMKLQNLIGDEIRIKNLQDELNQPGIIKEILRVVENFDNQIKLPDADWGQDQLPDKQLDQNDFSRDQLNGKLPNHKESGRSSLPGKQPGQNRFNKKQLQKIHQQAEETESFYISNCGLVILHPFLTRLFENVGYLENKLWLNEELQQRGIALTNFLVTGNEQLPEFDLLLNKIICGYPIENPLPDSIELSDLEKSEAHDLLHAVIDHWKALKNTSIDGLRSTFFIRDGKLNFYENTWQLKVEQKAYDILIDRLPWGISIIKLPWMRERLMVEWNS